MEPTTLRLRDDVPTTEPHQPGLALSFNWGEGFAVRRGQAAPAGSAFASNRGRAPSNPRLERKPGRRGRARAGAKVGKTGRRLPRGLCGRGGGGGGRGQDKAGTMLARGERTGRPPRDGAGEGAGTDGAGRSVLDTVKVFQYS